MVRKVLVIISLIFTAGYSESTQYYSLKTMANENNFNVSNNMDLGYSVVWGNGKKIKVFYLVPYITSESNIYYLKNSSRIGPDGSVLVSWEAESLIMKLIQPPVHPVYESNAPGSGEKINEESDGFTPIDSIVIDPGHGGKDPGGLSENGIKEKDVVLSIAHQLYGMLEKDDAHNVYMTRWHDSYVSLKERTDLSEGLVTSGKNPMFVSIHANISLFRDVSGIEVYDLSDKASDKEALSVETIENAGFSKKDIEQTGSLFSIIGDMLKDGIRRESEKLAQCVGKELTGTTGTQVLGIKKANFYVLRFNSMPSILVEVGFLSNGPESVKLVSKDYQLKLARGIYKGIMEFIDEYNKSRGFTQ